MHKTSANKLVIAERCFFSWRLCKYVLLLCSSLGTAINMTNVYTVSTPVEAICQSSQVLSLVLFEVHLSIPHLKYYNRKKHTFLKIKT